MNGLYLTNDLLFSGRVLGAALAARFNIELCMSVGRLQERLKSGGLALVLLDLSFPGLDVADLVREIRDAVPTAHLVAYGPHVQEATLAAARDAGCDQVLSRGQFNAEYVTILNRLLTPPAPSA